MSNYSKMFGAMIGSAVAMGLMALGVTETDLPQFQPFIDLVVGIVGSGLGAFIAPKNKPAS